MHSSFRCNGFTRALDVRYKHLRYATVVKCCSYDQRTTTAATITSANYIARGNRGWEKDAMVV